MHTQLSLVKGERKVCSVCASTWGTSTPSPCIYVLMPRSEELVPKSTLSHPCPAHQARPRPQKHQELRRTSTSNATQVTNFGPSEPSAALVRKHGLGDMAPDGCRRMGAAASGLRGGETELPHKKFVLPQAPVRPVTANGGQPMTSWMDSSRR